MLQHHEPKTIRKVKQQIKKQENPLMKKKNPKWNLERFLNSLTHPSIDQVTMPWSDLNNGNLLDAIGYHVPSWTWLVHKVIFIFAHVQRVTCQLTISKVHFSQEIISQNLGTNWWDFIIHHRLVLANDFRNKKIKQNPKMMRHIWISPFQIKNLSNVSFSGPSITNAQDEKNRAEIMLEIMETSNLKSIDNR